MAIWQFDCMVIIKDNIGLDIESEEILIWRDSNLLDVFYKKIESILPQEKSWSKERCQYGHIDKTCIELIYYKIKKRFIFKLRLDLRSLSKSDLVKILDMINEINGRILYQGEIYSPDLEILLELLKESDAARFCEDPRGFFENLNKIEDK